jgi:hypothetical protein
MMREAQRRLLSAVVAIVFTSILGTSISVMRPVNHWSSTNQLPPYWDSVSRMMI